MRTASVTLHGREYTLCFSTRVVRSCCECYGGLENIDKALSDENPLKVLDETLWMLSAMLDAGARYIRLNGGEPPQPPDQETLYDLCGMDDLTGLRAKVMASMAAGAQHTVEASPPKNAAAAQETGETPAPPALSGTCGTA